MARNLMSRAKAAITGRQSTEVVIDGLETTKLTLERRAAELEATKTAALDRRRDALIAGDDVSDAAQAARVAEDDLAAIADALSEVERRLAAAHEQKAAEDEQGRREVVAIALESDAAKVTSASADMASAVEAVARAHARLILAVSGRSAPQLMAHRAQISPTDFADGVLLQAIVAALPQLEFRAELFPGQYSLEKRVEPREAAEAGAEAAKRLRDTAARVRSGEVADNLPANDGKGFRVRLSKPQNVPVHPVRCFRWIDADGQERRATPLDCYLPEPVANAAVAAGLARREVGIDTQGARKVWERKKEVTPAESWFDGVEVVDLGVNLQADRAADEQRQRDAWRAEKAAERADLERRAA